jgi:cullin-associated NEDD8-dissociated protein 1
MAAAFGLGLFAARDLCNSLEFFKTNLSGDSVLYMLHAIKIAITNSSAESLGTCIEDVFNILEEHAQSPKDSIRNVIAEAMGRCVLLCPDVVLGRLGCMINPASSMEGVGWYCLASAISAVKYMVANWDTTSAQSDVAVFVRECMPDLVMYLDRSLPLHVRRAAILLISAAVNHAPELLVSKFGVMLERLYAESEIDSNLVQIVDLGPHKHMIDDGLELRKSVIETIHSLRNQAKLDALLDPVVFTGHIVKVMGDGNGDIRMFGVTILLRAGMMDPLSLEPHVSGIAKRIHAILEERGQPGQDAERAVERRTQALQLAAVVLVRVPNTSQNPEFAHLREKIVSESIMSSLFEQEVNKLVRKTTNLS